MSGSWRLAEVDPAVRQFRVVPQAEVAKTHEASSSSKAFAFFRSGVSKPSVNQP